MKLRVNVTKKGQINPADLRMLTIGKEVVTGRRYADLELDGFQVGESKLTSCVFSNIRSSSVSFGAGQKQSVYTDCVFERCEFEVAAAGNARMIRCEFRDCVLKRILGVALELVGCRFVDTTIKESVFHGTVSQRSGAYRSRQVNEFRNNDFSGATLEDTGFRGGIDLAAQRLPTGKGYLLVNDIPRARQTARVLIASLGPSDRKLMEKFLIYLELAEKNRQRATLLLTSELGALEDEWRSLMNG